MTTGFITLTPEEILTRWRKLRGWEPLCSGATAARGDDSNLNALLMLHIKAWYTRALLTYPAHTLPKLDFSAECSSPVPCAGGSALLSVPDSCLRPVSVLISGWDIPAEVSPPDSHTALLQLNPFTGGTASAPAAVLVSPGTLRITPADSNSTLTALRGIPAPADDRFILSPFLEADMAKNDFIDSLNSQT